MKPPLEGIIRSFEEIATNTHPLPILYGELDFQTFCVACVGPPGPPRSTVQMAIADRLFHTRSTHP